MAPDTEPEPRADSGPTAPSPAGIAGHLNPEGATIPEPTYTSRGARLLQQTLRECAQRDEMRSWPTEKLVEHGRAMERRHLIHDDPACLRERDNAQRVLLERWEAARAANERSHNGTVEHP